MDSFPGGQTSFIPKKPLVVTPSQYQQRGVSIVLLVSIIIFVTSVALAVGVFAYKSVLKTQIAGMQDSLNRARAAFEPALIQELQRLDQRITSAQVILHNHLATSALFDMLSRSTLQSVRFVTFSVGIDERKAVVVTMRGQARDYQSVALQSDSLASMKGVRNPIFSNLSLDPSGKVLFDVTFTVDPALVSYGSASVLTPSSSQNGSTATSSLPGFPNQP